MSKLFSDQSFHDFARAKIKIAEARADALSAEQLASPDLAGVLGKIVEEVCRFEIAIPRPELKHGRRRLERREVRDYRRLVEEDVSIIDVTIPCDGWPKSFSLTPTSSLIMGRDSSVSADGVLVSFPDDEFLEKNIDDFLEQVHSNLASLRSDLASLPGQVRQAMMAKVDAKKARDAEFKALDQARGFPIR